MSDHLLDRVTAAIGDHYLIEAELGRGGMAAVYRALDLRLHRRVAIKVLPPEHAFNDSVRSRFLREAQMAARLTHPNIVPIYAVDEVNGLVYFVMALVDGDSLARRLASSGPMPAPDVRAIVAAVADALDHAHQLGVVHRDIKPDNILLDRSTQRPMVTDFGIARAAIEEHRLTVTGMTVGTPAYMSPEQAMGEREVDGRSDLYSLGVVAYQMVAGETPFKAVNTPAMLMKHVSEPPPPLQTRRPDVPPDLARAIERSLAKQPEARWRTAADMRDAVLGRASAEDASRVPVDAHAAPSASVARIVQGVTPQRRPATPTAAASPDPVTPWVIPPPGLTPRELRHWYRDRRHMVREAIRAGHPLPPQLVGEKIARFRRSLLGYSATTAMLFVINAAMGGFPWFIFPALGMMVSLVSQLGSLWGDGVPLRRIFRGPARGEPVASSPLATPTPEAEALTLAPPDVLAGPHGAAIRRAVDSRRVVTDLLKRMTAAEREMLPPDLANTVEALVLRVVTVGTTLHRLDADANGSSLGSLDDRLVRLRKEPEGTERTRRLALLERQRATLADLLERRTTLLAQFESAALALETLKLDLVRFRSAGVSTALEDVTSATREARAVSRDIGHLLDAADEVRRL